MRSIFSVLRSASLGAVLLMSACSKESNAPAPSASPTAAPATAPAAASGGHAPAGVKPGSHEDWCGEHAVPESQCTRCNAELIPAFKATNDWCAEHGLPESQCTICNPGLEIKRPPKGA